MDSGVKVTSSDKEREIENEVEYSWKDEISESNLNTEKSKTEKAMNKETNTIAIWSKKNYIIIVGVGAAILIGIIVLMTGEKKVELPPDESQMPVKNQEPALSDEEKLQNELLSEGYGIDSATKDSKSQSLIPVQSDTFIKDLDGQDIPELFEVKTITYISDFVTYTKHRAVTGEGVELYWLDGKYKGQPCRVTMPYKYFKEIPEEGAVICTIEIVQTKDGNKLATWFQFDPKSYEKLMKK